ncbi:hypothetical protein HV819_06610 [Anaerococcus sp. AGMB00486]|uniref:CGNR zinc finger domain-containing protein n=1 Tax=Anaerococcus faecalis TaxID=2742993 RepID=A0ABX2NAZ3_9FIRM|nr:MULTISPECIES: hypothetical protein [Anaerococcus]MDD7305401.1 hypothetical protein [Peptoniphilaceae bacterium]MDY3006034.1 hypothetical protein [Anaerococcus porci]NVF11652.1 hypothetical protein [Anaerococcus faecalis]
MTEDLSREFLTYFTFENDKCICEIEKVADNKTNRLVENLVVKKVKEKDIPVAYFYGEGLKLSDIKDKSKNNILGEFLGIKKDDLYTYKSFFEKYGFLFTLDDDDFYSIDIDKVNDLKNNLLAFVFLMNNQFDNYLFYKVNSVQELLDATLYLIFKDESEFIIGDKEVFTIKKSKVKTVIDGANSHNESSHNIKQKIVNGQKIEYFEIKDLLSKNGINEIDVETYNDIKLGNFPQWFKNLCRVYKNKRQLLDDPKYNIVVDFLFHFSTEYLTFSQSDISLEGTFEDNLYEDITKDRKLLKALMEVSKILLEDEFETNLSSVTPKFNINDMKPDWKLPSLYTALYFSLFYMNSKENELRKCKNDNCKEFFQVSRTNSRKIYCSLVCCNAVAQRNYQKKQLQKKK